MSCVWFIYNTLPCSSYPEALRITVSVAFQWTAQTCNPDPYLDMHATTAYLAGSRKYPLCNESMTGIQAHSHGFELLTVPGCTIFKHAMIFWVPDRGVSGKPTLGIRLTVSYLVCLKIGSIYPKYTPNIPKWRFVAWDMMIKRQILGHPMFNQINHMHFS